MVYTATQQLYIRERKAHKKQDIIGESRDI